MGKERRMSMAMTDEQAKIEKILLGAIETGGTGRSEAVRNYRIFVSACLDENKMRLPIKGARRR